MVTVRQSSWDPNVRIFDFDSAAPGGRGGASISLDPSVGLASVAGVHKNVKMPGRSTGLLIADGLQQTSMPRPDILEAYNVEKSTLSALVIGGDGQGTLLGNLLADLAQALGATIIRWEPVPDGKIYHLRVYVAYP